VGTVTLRIVPTASAGRRGRPADPQFETRVFEAALDVYGELGWPGFTFTAVCRRARVGKSAIYRRWSEPIELLMAAVDSVLRIEDVDTGQLRTDLIDLATQVFKAYLSPHGLAVIRLNVDQFLYPELAVNAGRYFEHQSRSAFQAMQRAKSRGEIPPGVEPSMILDLVFGAVINHLLAYPSARRHELTAAVPKWCEQTVDLVLTCLDRPSAKGRPR
jgi:AcrR family transcriptional regulator